jgi:hypothetical protein
VPLRFSIITRSFVAGAIVVLAWAAMGASKPVSGVGEAPTSGAKRGSAGVRPQASRPRLRQPDGGTNYYRQFAHALPSSSSYFPIGVWLESVITPGDIARDKAAGVNLYVTLTRNSDLSLVQRSGMKAILQSSEWLDSQEAIRSPAVAGWELYDEIDMCCGPPDFAGGNGYDRLSGILRHLPADGRARYNNYGKGVMFWESDSDAARFVNGYQQLVTNDVYWFTDPNEASRPESKVAANYGITVDRMRALDARDGKRKPIWNFVEVGWPFTESAAEGGRTIAPEEIRAAVWHSLIAGARGIVYFNHSFGGPPDCQSEHVLRDVGCYAKVRSAVTALDAQIRRLARVLNSPFADGFVSTAARVRTMAKYYDGRFYVFAGNKSNAPRSATFRVPCVGNAVATVVDEHRSIRIKNGRFSDAFAGGNAVHIYRIDGGSSCGLPRPG